MSKNERRTLTLTKTHTYTHTYTFHADVVERKSTVAHHCECVRVSARGSRAAKMHVYDDLTNYFFRCPVCECVTHIYLSTLNAIRNSRNLAPLTGVAFLTLPISQGHPPRYAHRPPDGAPQTASTSPFPGGMHAAIFLNRSLLRCVSLARSADPMAASRSLSRRSPPPPLCPLRAQPQQQTSKSRTLCVRVAFVVAAESETCRARAAAETDSI